MEKENTEALLRTYLTIQQLVEDLYTQAENAASLRNYNDASVLTRGKYSEAVTRGKIG